MLLFVPSSDAVDWWSLGVLIYHCLTGETPFATPADDELRIYKRITKGAISWPSQLSAEAKDLISHLLVREPESRLGMVSGLAVHCMFCCHVAA